MRNVLLLLILSFVFHLRPMAQTELTDKTKVVFARNLRTYDGKKLDSLVCDIFYPTGAMSNEKYPVYFQFHAGNFTGGNRTNVTDYCDAMADYGFIVIAPDYRTGYSGASLFCAPGDDSTNLQEAIYRAMQDVNACIRYITNHAATYNVDTNWVFIGGNSAGGSLALNDAYVNDSLAAIYYPNTVANWGTLQSSGNNEPYNYTIKGVNAMWGGMPYWDSLINSKSAIPTILFKGGKDTNLPDGTGYYKECSSRSKVRAGLGIYNVMLALEKPSVYHFHNNAGHTAYDDAFCIDNAS
jgi:acetyl esterase/lipase